jgi:hypothetical protein
MMMIQNYLSSQMEHPTHQPIKTDRNIVEKLSTPFWKKTIYYFICSQLLLIYYYN